MGIIRITDTITLDVDADAAWAFVADYRRDTDWRHGVLSMQPTPADEVEVGTTTVEVMKVGGRSYTNDGEVTSVDTGRRFEWRTTAGATAHGARQVTPLDGGGCEVRLELTVEPSGVERLLAPVLAPILRRNLRRDLGRLGALLPTA